MSDLSQSPNPPPPLGPETVIDIVDRILHPAPTAFSSWFRWTGIILVVVLLAAPLAFASPFMPEDWACGFSAWLIGPGAAKEPVEHVCDWLVLVTQTAIFIFIGGIAFTEAFARRVASLAMKLQQASLDAEQLANEERRAKLKSAYDQLVAVGAGNQPAKEKIKTALQAIYTVYDDTTQLSTRYIWFGARGMVFNFPGGLYGFAGFICLLIQVWALSSKTLIDYLPASCAL